VDRTYSMDGGQTWSPNVAVNDKPINLNYGISFNSDIRQPPGVASTDYYAFAAWADTRLADDVTQTQDNFGAMAQFSPLPTTKNTVLPKVAAALGGLAVAGLVLLVVMLVRRGSEGPVAASSGRREQVTTR
jgi:hypothetical protein